MTALLSQHCGPQPEPSSTREQAEPSTSVVRGEASLDKWMDERATELSTRSLRLIHWHVRREFAKITTTAGLGDGRTPRELRHSFVSILFASGVPIEDISDLVGHSGTAVTETVYRKQIR